MMVFFTSVGFRSDLGVIRRGGRPLLVMIALVAVAIVFQNLISVGIAKGLGLDPLFGMASGSIPMSGGHGTSGGFAPLLEERGLEGATAIAMAAATFGLVAGSLVGGPLAERLIDSRGLCPASQSSDTMTGIEASAAAPDARQALPVSEESSFRTYLTGFCVIILAMALGDCLSKFLRMTGIAFPTYFGSLVAACLIRNLSSLKPALVKSLALEKVFSLGDICLQLFLGMAMSTLCLWELSSLALPLLLILSAQVVFMILFSVFAAFPLLGKDYDAAVLVSGICGFGLGATPNAMANMSAVCYKYRYTVNPFFIVPIIGAMFVDIINTAVVTVFLNLL